MLAVPKPNTCNFKQNITNCNNTSLFYVILCRQINLIKVVSCCVMSAI